MAKKVKKVKSKKAIVKGMVVRGDFKGKGITPKFGDTSADIKFGDKTNKPKFSV